MTMDARDKETTSTYRPENAQQQSYRIVSYRRGKTRKKSIVLSKCEGEEKKVNGMDGSRCGDVDGGELRCDAMRNAR